MFLRNTLSKTYPSILAGMIATITSCSPPDSSVADQTAEVVSPVQITGIAYTPLTEYTELTAVSFYQQKSYVKANINGYVQYANASVGMQVAKGTVLFKLITKEARAIGNAVNKLDPELQFSGVSVIRADQSGYITLISHQKGDYVQDGESLAVLSNQSSFAFLMDLPYEYHQLALRGKPIELLLPDGKSLSGVVEGSLPAVDSLAQTQRIIVRVNSASSIPEGLVAKARIIKSSSANAQVLPRSAVLTNETEDEFWVMKMINDSTAVKILVKKGIENAKLVEILSPAFTLKDRIISVGNYGIADTAKVKIVK